MSVPEELSVIGFDDVRECEKFVPALTTIRQDHGRRAALAVGLLRRLRDGECVAKQVKLPVALVVRDSVREVKLHKNGG